MELRVLRYFLAVAHEQNISRAARTLHISQPTLSRQLQDMEAELGTQLFTRGSRNITLTENGRFLLQQSEQILSLVDKTVNNINTHKSVVGELVIGAGESRANLVIAQVIERVTTKHPGIKIHLYSANADEQKAQLANGVLDFGILMNPSDKQKYDYLALPEQDRWGILVRKDSPLAKLPSISPNQLKKEPLIISEQRLVDDQLSGWLGGSLDHFNIVATYNLLYNASLLVEAGMGVALCIDKLINVTNSALCFVPLAPALHSDSSIIWSKKATFSVAAQVFIDELKATLKK